MQKITDQDVLNVLQGMTCDGDLAVLNDGQLDRKLYEKVNKVLVALGGKWNKKRKGHVFPKSAAELLANVFEDGTYKDTKKEDSFFETPAGLAVKLVEQAQIHAGMYVLEPSAGRGAIVTPLVEAGALVDAVEINGDFATHLLAVGARCVKVSDFLALPDDAPIGSMRLYPRIVMNPPFSTNNKQTDVAHVLKAWRHLAPGGILVAITSPSWTFRTDGDHPEFRAFVEEHGSFVKNPAKAFKGSGTNVETLTITLTKAA